MHLSTSELQTLQLIASNDRNSHMSRLHLERLSRLDLIEPAGCGVSLSLKGQQVLSGRK